MISGVRIKKINEEITSIIVKHNYTKPFLLEELSLNSKKLIYDLNGIKQEKLDLESPITNFVISKLLRNELDYQTFWGYTLLVENRKKVSDFLTKNGIQKPLNIVLKRRNKLIRLKVTPTDITNLENN